MVGDERLELGHHPGVVAGLHPGVDELLGHREPQLLQAQGLSSYAGELGELAERATAPETERELERRDPLGTRGMGEVLEPGRVQLDETHVEGIADATGPHDLVRQECSPEPRDVALQARARAESGDPPSQSASSNRSALTSLPRAATSTARSWRRFSPSTGTSTPPRRTSTGPSTLRAMPVTT